MRQARFTHRHGTAVFAAILTALLFAASPLLLVHHHHANGQDDARCAICLFVSSQVVTAHVPDDAAPELIAVGIVQTADEGRVSFLPVSLDNERAPPAA
jgi:hypothetical protein